MTLKPFSPSRLRELHEAIAVTAKANAENRNPGLGLETLVAADSAVREFEKYAAQHILALADRLQEADAVIAYPNNTRTRPAVLAKWRHEARERHASRTRGRGVK